VVVQRHPLDFLRDPPPPLRAEGNHIAIDRRRHRQRGHLVILADALEPVARILRFARRRLGGARRCRQEEKCGGGKVESDHRRRATKRSLSARTSRVA